MYFDASLFSGGQKKYQIGSYVFLTPIWGKEGLDMGQLQKITEFSWYYNLENWASHTKLTTSHPLPYKQTIVNEKAICFVLHLCHRDRSLLQVLNGGI